MLLLSVKEHVVLHTPEEIELAKNLARKAIEFYVQRNEEYLPETHTLPQVFQEKSGSFVTIYTVSSSNQNLRGCIGVPQPIMPLGESICHSAYSAAASDPRFPPLTAKELPSIAIEVEVLSPFQRIKFKDRDDLRQQIVIGQDGLYLIAGAFNKGLLLPVVPVNYGWDVDEYLLSLCRKANFLDPAKLDDSKQVEIYKFQAQVLN